MKKFRSFLYHKDCKAGKIFTDEEEYNQAKEDGWIDSRKEISTAKPGRPRKQGEK